MHLHWLEVMKPGERERQDFDERAVNLFTRAGDFSSAIKVVNRMMEDGITIKPNVCMLLLRRMRTQDPRHIKQVVELFQSETVQLDDLAFNALLDSMAYLKDSAHDIEAAFLVYKKSRGEGWITPASMYGTLIQSFCAADKYRRAFRYLQEYRRVTRVEPQLQPLDLSEANVLSGDGDTEASVAQEEEVYDDERFQKYARIQGGASARPDKQELWNQKLRFRYGTPSPNGLVCYPYTAIAYGLSKSLDPMPRRVRGLFLLMREDGITPDAEMCNILISTFFRWGWPHRALAIFESMCRPSKYPLPNASTFRKMFIGLNPLSRGRKKPVEGITARQLFCEMLKVDSLNASRSFSQSGPRAKNNIISTATYNAALGTFVTSGDFAAAWALLSYYSIHHVSPDKGTTKHVTLPLLRRMQLETLHGPLDELMWTDRLLGIRRAEFNTQERRVLLADRLYHLAHMEFGQSLESPEDFPTLIKRSPRLYKGERQELVFLAALLRAALRAQLGYTPQDDPKLVKRAIEIAYQRVMSEMAPFGRIVGLGKNLRHHRKIMLRGRQSIGEFLLHFNRFWRFTDILCFLLSS